MFRNRRFFVFSNSSLDLMEIRFFKTKLVGSGVVLGVLVIGVILLLNFLASDLLGLGYDRISLLNTENRILKDQIRELSQKMSSAERVLGNLADRGNELRLVADLKKIDDDTRTAAIGGAAMPVAANAFLTGEASEVLTAAQAMIERLTREVKLQQTSYDEIARRMEQNKTFFSHLPAIKPMNGSYSLNGFGMRVHPVLRVYRMHDGIDIINDVGTNVYAAGDGVVRFAGRTQGGYGVVVEVDHGYGYSSLYAHLSQVLVKNGRTVKRGELIARCGRTGLVSGPHLHYEIRHNGAKQNPVDYFFDDVDASRYRTLLASAAK
jgi:murein DD-endopeptidase MepM/ murein hydrolase activator NlpD